MPSSESVPGLWINSFFRIQHNWMRKNRGQLYLTGSAYYSQKEIRQNIWNSKEYATVKNQPKAIWWHSFGRKLPKFFQQKTAEVYAVLGLHPFGLIPSCWWYVPFKPVNGLRARSHGGRECSPGSLQVLRHILPILLDDVCHYHFAYVCSCFLFTPRLRKNNIYINYNILKLL